MENEVLTYEHPDALVSVAWLAERLNNPQIKIVDASYFVPGGIEPARKQYAEGHIPGAVFFDINAAADKTKSKEHAFPSAGIFAEYVGSLGISNDDFIVAYDHMGGALAAARVWFMFRAFGHAKVAVLDGGRTAWAAQGHTFSTFQLLDARGKGRFEGTEPEPRTGLRSGHIPGSANLPFLSLIDADAKTWKDAATIRAAFAHAGIDLAKPLTTTCGSGVSACTVALGAYLIGKADTAIYDGSWIEWGADTALPLETATVQTR
jgi:thiosulfate/3-mercaptopyruvate sulfurtransferase